MAQTLIALRSPDNTWSMPLVLQGPLTLDFPYSVACSADGAFIAVGYAEDLNSGGTGYVSVLRPVGSFIPSNLIVTGSLCVYHNTTINAALKVAGNIHLNGTLITGTSGLVVPCAPTLSDSRIKDNIVTLDPTDALATIKKLKPVKFSWISAPTLLRPYFAKATKGNQKKTLASSRRKWRRYFRIG